MIKPLTEEDLVYFHQILSNVYKLTKDYNMYFLNRQKAEKIHEKYKHIPRWEIMEKLGCTEKPCDIKDIVYLNRQVRKFTLDVEKTLLKIKIEE